MVAPVASAPDEPAAHRYARYRALLADEPLPAALVDLDALDHNVDVLLAPVRRARKRLRVASKSLRCVALLRYIAERGRDCVRGVMAYAPREAAALCAQGFDDVLLAYPTARADDARVIAAANAAGATLSVVVDAPEHLAVLDAAAREARTTIPVVVDVDMSLRLLGDRAHLGVRRSPLCTAAQVAEIARRAADRAHLRFHGVMGYEAQVAGLPDGAADGTAPWMRAARRLIKRASVPHAARLRREVAALLAARGLGGYAVFNGGGSGSVHSSCDDDVLTEVTAGSGFLDSHLFDHYAGLPLRPACCFALQVTRRPAAGLVTCQGGGYVASGAAGVDRLPRPYLPAGLALLPLEGAGEVQTPLAVPPHLALALGDPVFFRHAKAGELAEYFEQYLLVRGDRVIDRVATYRGQHGGAAHANNRGAPG